MNAKDEAPSSVPWNALLVVGGVILVLLVLAALLLPQICSARETARGNTCRNNMRALANALVSVATRNGAYPGYMNVLQEHSGRPFTDPTIAGSTDPVPVSWAVMILPEIDRKSVYDEWIKLPPPPAAANAAAVVPAVPGSTNYFTDRYIDQFLCPSDFQQSKTGTPISFVVNTGLPDRPAAILPQPGVPGMPRDWGANGMFFDNFSEHPLVKAENRGPMVYMYDGKVFDPKDKTILLTEKIDATSYVLTASAHGAEGWKAAEVQLGCIWRPGAIDAAKKPPTMVPPVPSLAINADMGKGTGTSYDYCRPSSRHPQSVNMAFVGTNIAAVRDTISYFVYAKLMASDDENVKTPGIFELMDRSLRTYELTDEDVNP